jgi:hypothetical protein
MLQENYVLSEYFERYSDLSVFLPAEKYAIMAMSPINNFNILTGPFVLGLELKGFSTKPRTNRQMKTAT